MKIPEFLNLCAVYYTIQLVRCGLISFIVSAIIFLLRKTLFKHTVFLKGALWCLLIPVLFVGKMKFFYENKIGFTLFTRWTHLFTDHTWMSWLYLWAAFSYGVFLFYRRRQLKKTTGNLEKRKIGDQFIYITPLPVTPFSTGLLKPKIIVPEILLKEYSQKELQEILLHEKKHIRLGHLWFFFLFDILRALLWPNPLLISGTKFLREDMEEICDLETIKHSGINPYAYGQLLLKSMKILQGVSENFNIYAAFAGEKEYRNIHRRMTAIARYRPYKRRGAITLSIALLCAIGTIAWIKNISYERYQEDSAIFAYGYDGENITFYDDNESFHQMITYDDKFVYVEREAFETYISEKYPGAGDIYIVFGGFYKLPGFGAMGYSCFYEPGFKKDTVKIPYENPMGRRMETLIKML